MNAVGEQSPARLRIVSGAQTGADRAALNWAISRGFECGGWCPAGRRAEDGVIRDRYRMRETPSRNDLTRTRWNVRDSDGTAVISVRPLLTGGSLATLRLARRLGKPVVHIHAEYRRPWDRLRAFVIEQQISVLNIAGPRASQEPGIEDFVLAVLRRAFDRAIP